MCRKFVELNTELKSAGIHHLTRGGILRSSFNYLLLDPRLTQNLPLNHIGMAEQVSCLFYWF